MEFSNSSAPVSRETWAPRSPSPPPRAGGDYSDRAPPSGPRGGDDAPREPSNGGDYERDRDGRDSRRDNGQETLRERRAKIQDGREIQPEILCLYPRKWTNPDF
ncbi:uncharacterized protein I303_104380 [Kwoniella dejecticola CBS 10117]|uniref:Uncharacterized protein n=1 Tax=Kwoniella dejecticola CBS 10117 TaxID=1296121 RepID=A0A1A6A5H0_9TREE|nr:uncharacterized protein I303_04643 [Kwoniella dejecticola CBS 10117]OBR85308.1 hypothetical protein I303_04643 [Kwoniella dejecticola CBS 10117]